jgi:hypothetical protein
MGQVVIAEYDAGARALRLSEPLTDVRDREKVRVSIDTELFAPSPSNVHDALERLGSLQAPTSDIEQMLAEIEAGRR